MNYDSIMVGQMIDRSARVRRSMGLDQAVRPDILARIEGDTPVARRAAKPIPHQSAYEVNARSAMARNDRRAAEHVRWAETKIEVIADSVGCDPYQLIEAGVRSRASSASRNEYEVSEQDPESEVYEDPEIQNLADEINRLLGRGSARKPSARDSSRSYGRDAGKCRECRLADSGQRTDARTETRAAIARLEGILATL
jgi:hypothetical protein